MDSSYIIRGGRPLEGEIPAGGNKNAALPCIAAALLTNEPVELSRVPEIEDVQVMLQLAQEAGACITRLAGGRYRIQRNAIVTRVPGELADRIRASILLAAPMLAVGGSLTLPPPGGDVIGYRRLDTHFLVFSSFGGEASIQENGDISVEIVREPSGEVFLDEASVTATENAVMLASAIPGRTVITNAASEPHVQDLCRMLVLMGAHIEGIGSNLLTVEGSRNLRGCSVTLGPDYMEIGSYIGLIASVGGRICITGVEHHHLRMISLEFGKLGISWEKHEESLVCTCTDKRSVVPDIGGIIPKIDDAPWPGFPSDLMSIMAVTATQTAGTVLIHEKMFESRLFFVDTLIRMGASIIVCDPHRAVITGPSRLKGQDVASPDVRAGMALVIAALSARGESRIQNVYQIERGYEGLCRKLSSIGADIKRIP